MTRSMAPTIAKLDRRAQAEIDTDRLATSYRHGKDDGFTAGKRHAYTRMGWALTALAALCVVAAWLVV